jgi:Reverse transcriptase (RNA-dependent DNA polymerase).
VFLNVQAGLAADCTGSVTTRIINANNITFFASSVEETKWEDFYNFNCSDLATSMLNVMHDIAETSFPLKSVPNRHVGVRWFNDKLRKMRLELLHVKALFDSDKSANNWKAYCDLKKSYKKAIKVEKRNTYSFEINNSVNKAKSIWNIVNSERKIKKSIFCPNNLSAVDYNIYLSNICNNILPTIEDSFSDFKEFLIRAPKPSCSFFMLPISDADVRNAFNNLKNCSGLDYYGLNSLMIKACMECLIEPITVLFNKCVDEGIWPDSLKICKIFPLHKKGDLDCMENFRPIATVPVVSKLFEIIIKHRLTTYFESKHIFSDAQYGFRKNRSTLKALTALVEAIVQGFDAGIHSNAKMCDLTKAFDCVNVDILLYKLDYYGVRGNMFDLLASYLTNRQQYVCVNDCESGLLTVESGVPQGSVLGPILFLIFINDLPYSIGDATCIVFADDTTLIARGDDLISNSFRAAQNWFSANKLKLNVSKTQSVLFSTDKRVESSTCNLLGLTLDTRLIWSSHIDRLCSRLSSQIFCIRQMRRCLSSDVLRTVYFAVFHSHLMYGVTLWGNSQSSHRVFILQKAAVRTIEGAPYRATCLPLFQKYRIMTLPCIYIFQTLLQIHRNLDTFQRHSDVHSYGTRNVDNLIQPFSRIRTTQLNKLDTSLYNHFVRCFVGVNVVELSFNKFYKLCKDFLIANCFYSVNDYLKFSGY